MTPCNVAIPAISAGRFALGVYTERSSVGCGRPKSRVVLWTYVGPKQLFSTQAIDWPTVRDATVAVDFSTTDPAGAAPSVLELSGEVHRPDGSSVPAGARVEAFIGSARCGVASVMDYGGFVGYVLYVVGPDSIPACSRRRRDHLSGRRFPDGRVLREPRQAAPAVQSDAAIAATLHPALRVTGDACEACVVGVAYRGFAGPFL